MTEQNAIYCLKVMSQLEPNVCEECSLYGQVGADHCYEDVLHIAIKSLEKEISVSREIRHGDYFCPKCGSNVEYQGYCHACGQRVY